MQYCSVKFITIATIWEWTIYRTKWAYPQFQNSQSLLSSTLDIGEGALCVTEASIIPKNILKKGNAKEFFLLFYASNLNVLTEILLEILLSARTKRVL